MTKDVKEKLKNEINNLETLDIIEELRTEYFKIKEEISNEEIERKSANKLYRETKEKNYETILDTLEKELHILYKCLGYQTLQLDCAYRNLGKQIISLFEGKVYNKRDVNEAIQIINDCNVNSNVYIVGLKLIFKRFIDNEDVNVYFNFYEQGYEHCHYTYTLVNNFTTSKLEEVKTFKIKKLYNLMEQKAKLLQEQTDKIKLIEEETLSKINELGM